MLYMYIGHSTTCLLVQLGQGRAHPFGPSCAFTHTYTYIHKYICIYIHILYINILLHVIYKKKIVEWAPIALGSEYEHNRYIVCTPTTVIHKNNNTYT